MKIRLTLSIFLLTLSTILFGLQAFSVELSVKSFELLPIDISARTNQVKDLNGDVCALIKISLPERECRFDGGVVKQSYDITEYLVYVSPGTRRFQIKYSGTETLNLDLQQLLGGEELKSGSTYRLTLSGYEELARETPKKADSGVNYLILNITPSKGVSVKVDGNPQSVENGQTTTLLKYGNHEYVVEADGYAPVRGTATVDKSGKTTVNVKLESIMATLDVRSATPGATIKVNNENKGTGSYNSTVKPGSYTVEISKEGYDTYKETFVLSEKENKKINVDLESIMATLDVSSSTPGATIKINNENKGTGKYSSTVKPGFYTVEISKEGYDTYTEKFELSKKEHKKINVNLESVMANLYIKTRDYDAIIKINNQNKGKGNFSSSVMPGLYELEVTKESHRPYTKIIELTKGDNKTIEVPELTPITGMLNVEVKPNGASISIDGKVVDSTPAVINDVLIGDRKVTITKDGYEPMTLTATVSEGEISRLDGSLLEKPKEEELFIAGEEARKESNYAKAIKLFKEGANLGDTNCQNALGEMYSSGAIRNYVEALKWYRKAANAGNAKAMYNLGDMYKYGYGVEKDHTEVMKWYRKAADGGNTDAMYYLGDMYNYGSYEIKKDYTEALKWYRKAADAGNRFAMNKIGKIYESGGYGVTKDYEEALEWYRKAAEGGNSEIKNKLKELGIED